MGLLSTIGGWITGGVISSGADAVKNVAEVWRPNAEARAQREHDANAAVLGQFADEFHERKNRTALDSIADALNRLVRPVIALSVIGFFLYAPIDPAQMLKIAAAYEKMPLGFWSLMTVIIGFYFGGRMQLKSQDFAVKGGALAAAKNMIEQRKAFRELAADDEDQAPGVEVTGENSVVKKWLEMKGAR